MTLVCEEKISSAELLFWEETSDYLLIASRKNWGKCGQAYFQGVRFSLRKRVIGWTSFILSHFLTFETVSGFEARTRPSNCVMCVEGEDENTREYTRT